LLVENKRGFRRFELFQEVGCRRVVVEWLVFDGKLFGGGVGGVFRFIPLQQNKYGEQRWRSEMVLKKKKKNCG
jgi:hypothetical protein